jgi:hypothetical protein
MNVGRSHTKCQVLSPYANHKLALLPTQPYFISGLCRTRIIRRSVGQRSPSADRQTDTQGTAGPLHYQNKFQPLYNFCPRNWRPKLPCRSFIRTGRPWMSARDDYVRNTWITMLYDNVSYVLRRLRVPYRAQYLCNTQFCTFTSLDTDQVTSCFLTAVNTNPFSSTSHSLWFLSPPSPSQ